MMKEGLYLGFIGAFLFLMVSIQNMVSADMLNFMAIMVFVMFAILFVGILDKFFMRRIER